MQEDNRELRYFFKNQEIISDVYNMKDDITEEEFEIQEFYKKRDH